MKKIISVLVLLMLVLSMTSCFDDMDEPEEEIPEEEDVESEDEDTEGQRSEVTCYMISG